MTKNQKKNLQKKSQVAKHHEKKIEKDQQNLLHYFLLVQRKLA